MRQNLGVTVGFTVRDGHDDSRVPHGPIGMEDRVEPGRIKGTYNQSMNRSRTPVPCRFQTIRPSLLHPFDLS